MLLIGTNSLPSGLDQKDRQTQEFEAEIECKQKVGESKSFIWSNLVQRRRFFRLSTVESFKSGNSRLAENSSPKVANYKIAGRLQIHTLAVCEGTGDESMM